MAKVEWSRLGGDECEGVLGVLLLRRHPRARRVRPSQGDRGVDVYVPGPDGRSVFQIKSFTGRLTPARKRQINKSWTRFTDLVRERQLTVAEWHLVRPENATDEDEAYLAELTAEATWPCGWMGLDHCDELAASYPDVIDYYLRDGKDRLEATVRQHLVAAGFASRTKGDLIQPEASIPTLQAIHDAINSLDPHRYDFAVFHRPASVTDDHPDWPPLVALPDLVASAIRHEPIRAIVFNVFSRFDEASEERPVPLSFRVTADEDSAEGRAWRDFVDYGVATRQFIPVSDLHMDVPGGLGGRSAVGAVRVGPAAPDRVIDWTVSITGPEGKAIASVDLRGGPLTSGISARGSSLELVDPQGAVELEFRINHETLQSTYTLRHLPLFGKRPRAVLPGIRLVAAFHAPNAIQLAPAGGPPLSPPMALTGAPNPAFEQVLSVLEILATIQQRTHEPLVLPCPDRLADEVPTWERAARLVLGETLRGDWTPMTVGQVSGPEPALGDVVALECIRPLTVRVGGDEVPLGNVRESYSAARVDRVIRRDDADDELVLHVSPFGSSTCTIRLADAYVQG